MLLELEKPVLSSYGQPFGALAWSPDAGWLYFAESVDIETRPLLRLWRISIEDMQKNIIFNPDGVVPFGLSMNPDGRRIETSFRQVLSTDGNDTCAFGTSNRFGNESSPNAPISIIRNHLTPHHE